MTPTVESFCCGVRDYLRRGSGWRSDTSPPELGKLKFSALNDAVSKALTGVPYSRAVAAERAGKPYPINICPASTATVAATYGVDAHELYSAIGSAALAQGGARSTQQKEFWPFPERERAMDRLMTLMEAPIDGRHVFLAAHDVTAGTSTTIRELMRRTARKGEGSDYVYGSKVSGSYLLLSLHVNQRLDGLATDALVNVLDPPIEAYYELPSGKVAIESAIKAARDAGLVRPLFDELSMKLKRLPGEARIGHYLRGIERFVLGSPVKALFECSCFQSKIANAMPEVWAKSDVVVLDPISDSPSLRGWIADCDPMQCVGEYDDSMVKGLLSVTGGNLLLMRRYLKDAVMAVMTRGQVKDVVRMRLRLLADKDLQDVSCWAISSWITEGNMESGGK